MRSYIAVAVLAVALAVATVFAVWSTWGDAPLERATACRDSAPPCPSPSQEESEKVACLQGGGNWIWLEYSDSQSLHRDRCGRGTQPCWSCFHPMN